MKIIVLTLVILAALIFFLFSFSFSDKLRPVTNKEMINKAGNNASSQISPLLQNYTNEFVTEEKNSNLPKANENKGGGVSSSQNSFRPPGFVGPSSPPSMVGPTGPPPGY